MVDKDFARHEILQYIFLQRVNFIFTFSFFLCVCLSINCIYTCKIKTLDSMSAKKLE